MSGIFLEVVAGAGEPGFVEDGEFIFAKATTRAQE